MVFIFLSLWKYGTCVNGYLSRRTRSPRAASSAGGVRAPSRSPDRGRRERPRVSSGRRMTYEAIATFLRACPVFAGVPAREMAALAAVAREETYRARDYVFTEGDQADWFCLVRSGRVKILRASRGGK